MGHKISEKRISPDPEKVKTIKGMPFRSSKQDLQRFLGMIAYLSKFIPQLSEETHLLRELLKKDAIWKFTLTHRNQFDKLRSMVSEKISLKFFNPKLPTKIACDSSKFGIGATLEQKHGDVWHPVAFKSRSCTSAEQNYCPLERETLAIVFACSKYLYGKKLIVEGDHKPLKSILHSPIHKIPPSTLIKEMKQILYTGHQRTKSNARSTMYWPNIDKNINEMISNCNACQKYRNLNPREPFLWHEIPEDV